MLDLHSAERRKVRLISREIPTRDVITIHQRCRRMDRQTTYHGNTALRYASRSKNCNLQKRYCKPYTEHLMPISISATLKRLASTGRQTLFRQNLFRQTLFPFPTVCSQDDRVSLARLGICGNSRNWEKIGRRSRCRKHRKHGIDQDIEVTEVTGAGEGITVGSVLGCPLLRKSYNVLPAQLYCP